MLKKSDLEIVPIERAFTLPSEWYTNENIYQLELDRIFTNTWQYAGSVFELPKKVRSVFRYCIGIDPFDDDLVEYSTSLGSCIVFDRWTRRIVAEYTGRPPSANEFYEICYRLARFYNCRIMYESNKKGLYTYFNNVKNAITMLADTPDILVDKQLTKPRGLGTNVSKGVNVTAAINSYGLRLQADWMMEKAYEETVKEDDEENKDSFTPNFRKIRSIGYLKECIGWHSKLNADRVSAMNMVMIYDAELSQYESGGERKETVKMIDPFFDRVYKGGNGSLTEFGYKQANYIFGNK